MSEHPYQDPYQGQQPYQQGYSAYDPYSTPQQPPYQQQYVPPASQQSPYQQQALQPVYQSPVAQQQKRGRSYLVTLVGVVLAFLGFLLPYFADYSGYQLAGLYGLYWLDPLFIVAATILMVVILVAGKGRLALGLIGIGVVAAFLHYLIVSVYSTPTYWGFGAWLYFVGMIVVAIGGLPLLFVKKH